MQSLPPRAAFVRYSQNLVSAIVSTSSRLEGGEMSSLSGMKWKIIEWD